MDRTTQIPNSDYTYGDYAAYKMRNDGGAGGLFCSQYSAVYSSFTTKPSESVAAAQNTMVKALVDAGTWDKMDVFYLFAQESNGGGEALVNWINPGTYNATAVNSPTFTSLEGIAGNGTTSYINTNFQPSLGAKLSQNSTSFSIYSRTNAQSSDFDGIYDTGSPATRLRVRIRSTGDLLIPSINDTASSNIAGMTDSTGLFYFERSGAANTAVYRNNASIGTGTESSVAPSDIKFYICAQNNNGSADNFGIRQFSSLHIGAALSSGERTALKDAIEAYMDSNSKGVIT
jgi:hypothetical protein